MSVVIGGVRVAGGTSSAGSPALVLALIEVTLDGQRLDAATAVAKLDRREVEDLRDLCDRFLAGEQVRL